MSLNNVVGLRKSPESFEQAKSPAQLWQRRSRQKFVHHRIQQGRRSAEPARRSFGAAAVGHRRRRRFRVGRPLRRTFFPLQRGSRQTAVIGA